MAKITIWVIACKQAAGWAPLQQWWRYTCGHWLLEKEYFVPATAGFEPGEKGGVYKVIGCMLVVAQ